MIFARYNIVRFSDSLPIASGLGKQARYNRESSKNRLRGQKTAVKPGKQTNRERFMFIIWNVYSTSASN